MNLESRLERLEQKMLVEEYPNLGTVIVEIGETEKQAMSRLGYIESEHDETQFIYVRDCSKPKI